jgi:hypothetical protein
MAATGAAAIAGLAGLAAYLNGKYHIAQDLKTRKKKKQAVKYYAELGTQSQSAEHSTDN